MWITKNRLLTYFEETFPEKYLQIFDLDFTDRQVQTFIDKNKIEHLLFFDVNKFKIFLGETFVDYFVKSGEINSLKQYQIGEIIYDATDDCMKIYDGSKWLEA